MVPNYWKGSNLKTIIFLAYDILTRQIDQIKKGLSQGLYSLSLYKLLAIPRKVTKTPIALVC